MYIINFIIHVLVSICIYTHFTCKLEYIRHIHMYVEISDDG